MLGLVDQACVEKLIDQSIFYFRVSYRHVHYILLSPHVLFVLVRALERILLNDEIIETASERPDVNSSCHV